MEPQPATTPLRASDSDRDATIERLGDALAEGALDTTEYDIRLQQATTATTLAQLHPLTADLPASQATLAKEDAARKAAQHHADKRAWLNEWSYWTGGAAIMTAIWAVNSLREGEWSFYWPLAPLGIWAAILVSYAIWPERDRTDHPTRH
ncbi:DUF1707 SHOCT-like domain-containing protein [Actinomadura viridis]|uniref:DUF1707 domain-containing protein n=1 Tax=Actinomadura viridis TaxID=58110 RepID=A0A931DMB6_9ACTN|nr:DUF1707 domain-containing protein [Actinomadura viridis]MBG6089715.1 hypothetical protein [Actinomadura viridis]